MKQEKTWAHWGRNTFRDGVLCLGWSGSCLETETNSPAVEMDLVTDAVPLEETYLGRAGIYVDGEQERTILLRGPITVTVPLAPGKTHTVRLVRLSEAAFGLVGVRAVRFEEPAGEGLIARPPRPSGRRIEFIGDSITCGYGIEAGNEFEPFATRTENPVKAYACLTARGLNAQAQLVSWSGIGVLSDYVPPEAETPREEVLMGWLYPFENWQLDTRMGIEPGPCVPGFHPQLAVINLGTNDASYTRGIRGREEAFGRRYRELLDTVHRTHPDAAILCCLGVMGTALCPEAERQALRFARETPGCRVLWHAFREQDGARDGYGADFHPSETTHRRMAAELEAVIRDMMDWRD